MRSALFMLSLVAPLAAAQDPLKSEACAGALAALQEARAAPPEAARVEAARRRAAQACLGGGGAAQRPAPAARAPLAVPAPVLAPPAPPAAIVPRPLPPPPEIERPAVVTTCDAGGCWDSRGRRLNRAGDVLLGPGGRPCVASGAAVHCP